mgnify:CR=1 FL=1
MKILILSDKEPEQFEVTETQADVIRQFLKGDEASVWRYGYIQGHADQLTAIIYQLKEKKENLYGYERKRISQPNKRDETQNKQETKRA